MHVTADVCRDRVLRPTPGGDCAREEFQLAARRGKAAFDFAVDLDTHQPAAFAIAVWARDWNDIRRCRLSGTGENATEVILLHVVEFFVQYCLFIKRASFLFDFERAVTPHEVERT